MLAPVPPDELGEGVIQQVLFYNRLSIVARWGHPLARKKAISPAELLRYFLGAAGAEYSRTFAA